MLRSLVPSSIRRFLIFAAVASGLALGLNSPYSRAEQAEKPKTIAKEDLRYDGKTFDDWRAYLRTELKPENRAEAIRALGIFGAKGYAKDAAVAILDAVRDHDRAADTRDDNIVLDAAEKAFQKMGPEGLSRLLDEMKQGPVNGRRFAVWQLRFHEDPQCNPVLTEGLKDSDAYVRRESFTLLNDRIAEDQRDSQVLVPALRAALELKDDEGFKWARHLFYFVGPDDSEAITSLVHAAKHSDYRVRSEALFRLVQIDHDQTQLKSLVITALKDENQEVRSTARKSLWHVKVHIDAVPVLNRALEKKIEAAKERAKNDVTAVQQGSNRVFSHGAFDEETAEIVETLEAYGTRAKSAVALLKELASAEDGTVLGDKARDALKAIKPDPDETPPPPLEK